MHPILKSQMIAFSTENDIRGDDSNVFEIYSVYSVLNGRFGNSVKPADGHLKGSEFGIDGVEFFVNGELIEDFDTFSSVARIHSADIHFSQSKTSSSFDYGEFAKFIDAVINFINEVNRDQTEQLKAAGAIFNALYASSSKWTRNPSLNLTYIFTGTFVGDAHSREKIASFEKFCLEKSLFSDVNVEIVGASDLQQYYRRATESATATFDFKSQITLPENGKVKESYIGYLPVEELMKIISDSHTGAGIKLINRKIFYDNVRDYDPESPINQSISEELSKDHNSFVFRNNGVTIVARNSSRTGDRFTIESFQVVNGCQTCNIIFDNYGSKISSLAVPLRLIVSNDEDFINSIIVGTNKQNPVKEEQFWALRPFLKQFEEYARAQPSPRTLYFERRENQYRYDNVPEKTRIIEPSSLMKSVVAMYLHLPHRAGRDYREVKKEFSDHLFIEKHDVQLYHAAAFAHYKLEFCFRTGRISTEYKKYRMYLMWAIAAANGVQGDILSAKSSKAGPISDKICRMCEDDDQLAGLAHKVVAAIENSLKENSWTVEQLRNESTSEALRKSIAQAISS